MTCRCISFFASERINCGEIGSVNYILASRIVCRSHSSPRELEKEGGRMDGDDVDMAAAETNESVPVFFFWFFFWSIFSFWLI